MREIIKPYYTQFNLLKSRIGHEAWMDLPENTIGDLVVKENHYRNSQCYKALKQVRMILQRGFCGCGKPLSGKVVVHHKNRYSFHQEMIEDMTILCKDCYEEYKEPVKSDGPLSKKVMPTVIQELKNIVLSFDVINQTKFVKETTIKAILMNPSELPGTTKDGKSRTVRQLQGTLRSIMSLLNGLGMLQHRGCEKGTCLFSTTTEFLTSNLSIDDWIELYSLWFKGKARSVDRFDSPLVQEFLQSKGCPVEQLRANREAYVNRGTKVEKNELKMPEILKNFRVVKRNVVNDNGYQRDERLIFFLGEEKLTEVTLSSHYQ
jgi:hypothetical protein